MNANLKNKLIHCAVPTIFNQLNACRRLKCRRPLAENCEDQNILVTRTKGTNVFQQQNIPVSSESLYEIIQETLAAPDTDMPSNTRFCVNIGRVHEQWAYYRIQRGLTNEEFACLLLKAWNPDIVDVGKKPYRTGRREQPFSSSNSSIQISSKKYTRDPFCSSLLKWKSGSHISAARDSSVFSESSNKETFETSVTEITSIAEITIPNARAEKLDFHCSCCAKYQRDQNAESCNGFEKATSDNSVFVDEGEDYPDRLSLNAEDEEDLEIKPKFTDNMKAHFEFDQFEKYIPEKLKPNAVPTLFPQQHVPKHTQSLYNGASLDEESVPSAEMKSVSNETEHLDHSYYDKAADPSPTAKDAEHITEDPPASLEFFIDDLRGPPIYEDTESMKRQIEELTHKCFELEMEKHSLAKCLSTLFNSDELEYLKGNRHKNWTEDTIKKALRIESACGYSGYQTLLDLGYPLPPYKTLFIRSSGTFRIQ